MVQRLFSQHFDYGEGLAAFAALEAGGFHPNFENYHHTTMAIAYIDALGGLKINLPEEEFYDAKDWLSFLRKNPITDFDPIKRKPVLNWIHASLFSMVFSMSPAPWLILFLLPPLFLFVLYAVAITIGIVIEPVIGIAAIPLLIFPAILMHAKYVAGPKFVKERDVPTRSI